jgi:pimeloyl-ACP methyl ester carboxylesterase
MTPAALFDAVVVALVYVAAFALDTGQSALGLLGGLSPHPLISTYLVFDSPTAPMFATISPEVIKRAFANGLGEIEQINLTATQGPTSLADLTATPTVTPAWKSKPSWFIIAENDNVITPGLERQEAEHIHARSIVLPTCHVAMLQEPIRVASFITDAARSLHGD